VTSLAGEDGLGVELRERDERGADTGGEGEAQSEPEGVEERQRADDALLALADPGPDGALDGVRDQVPMGEHRALRSAGRPSRVLKERGVRRAWFRVVCRQRRGVRDGVVPAERSRRSGCAERGTDRAGAGDRKT